MPQDETARPPAHDESTNTTLTITSLTCPVWCEQPAGHPFDSLDEGAARRRHSREGACEIHSARGTVAVELGQVEHVHPTGVVRDPVTISIWGYSEGDPLDATQARQLAAELLEQADEWDRIIGEEVASCR